MIKPLRRCRVCGVEAWNENDLENFKKRTGYPHNRLTICKICNKKGLRKPKPPYLRKCRKCGLEAKTEKDLKSFTNHYRQPYGKDNLCKKCGAKQQKQREYHTDELIEVYKKRNKNNKVYCYFCGKEVFKFNGHVKNALDNHSLDENHSNWNHNNKAPAHRSCHGTHHAYKSNTAQHINRWRERNKSN